jgi:hypothetical protein
MLQRVVRPKLSASGGSRGFPEPLSAAAPLVGRIWTMFAGIRATRPTPHFFRISGSANVLSCINTIRWPDPPRPVSALLVQGAQCTI